MIPLYEGYEDNEVTTDNLSNSTLVIIISIIFIIWFTTGILAFLTSLICFAFHGTISDKFLGLIIALIIGPFYWFYFIFNNTGYCSRSAPGSF